MIKRPTWVILALFVGLVAFAVLFQRWRGQQNPEGTPSPAVARLLNFEQEALESVRIENAAGDVVLLERDAAGGWALTQPEAGPADASQVDSAASQLVFLRVLESLTPPDDLEAFGLLRPTTTLTLGLRGGQTHTLEVGGKAPAVSGYYVSLDGSPPRVVAQYGLDPFINMLESPPFMPTATPAASETLLPDASGTPAAGETPSPEPTIQP